MDIPNSAIINSVRLAKYTKSWKNTNKNKDRKNIWNTNELFIIH